MHFYPYPEATGSVHRGLQCSFFCGERGNVTLQPSQSGATMHVKTTIHLAACEKPKAAVLPPAQALQRVGVQHTEQLGFVP